jgi:hypothetical protein
VISLDIPRLFAHSSGAARDDDHRCGERQFAIERFWVNVVRQDTRPSAAL